MSSRVGICAHASLLAAQLLRVRESEAWTKTGKVQVASSFIGSLVSGQWIGMGEAEAAATGMWCHGGAQQDGYWDDGVMEIVGGSREEGRKIRGWLGEVDLVGGKRVGTVSRYLVDRYGFDPGGRLLMGCTEGFTDAVNRYYRHSVYLGLSLDISLSLPFSF